MGLEVLAHSPRPAERPGVCFGPTLASVPSVGGLEAGTPVCSHPRYRMWPPLQSHLSLLTEGFGVWAAPALLILKELE